MQFLYDGLALAWGEAAFQQEPDYNYTLYTKLSWGETAFQLEQDYNYYVQQTSSGLAGLPTYSKLA